MAARILLLLGLVGAGLSQSAAGQARVEVTRSAGTVTIREEIPPEVALDPAGRVYHVEGCPSTTPAMRRLRPGAAVLSGYRQATDCAGRKPPKTYRTTSQPIKPRDGRALNVLFVGNSYTYYNELPWLLERISAGEAKPVKTHAVTMSGATLSQHWESGAALKAMNLDSYDYVVLQEQSLTPAGAFERMRDDAALFNEEIRRTGAETVLFQTWAPRDRPELQDPISSAYLRIGRELNARVARVGDAWRLALSRRPGLRLHDESSHPSLAGSYLAACVFYSLLYGKSPEGLPHEFPAVWKIPEASRAALVSERLTAEEALFLQRTAWETAQR
ncbi:MAG TPA: hypothetical protein VGQ32_05400 [Thermoanaerobaculia bacterium]|nr:hypothetical protein [Thermoanaerobaculia bacterium]